MIRFGSRALAAACVLAACALASTATAGPWSFGLGGGVVASGNYEATRIHLIGLGDVPDAVFQPDPPAAFSAFVGRAISRRLSLRLVAGDSRYTRDLDQSVIVPLSPATPIGTSVRQRLDASSLGLLLRIEGGRAPNPIRGYAQAGPVISRLAWHQATDGLDLVAGEPFAVHTTEHATQWLPGAAWAAGIERPLGGHLVLGLGLSGVVVSAPGQVALSGFDGRSVRPFHQWGLGMNLGWAL